jgi:hypothetical protein
MNDTIYNAVKAVALTSMDSFHIIIIRTEKQYFRAVNSAVECHLHTVEVTGSIPVPPTISLLLNQWDTVHTSPRDTALIP